MIIVGVTMTLWLDKLQSLIKETHNELDSEFNC
jgi:hypothetical protein